MTPPGPVVSLDESRPEPGGRRTSPQAQKTLREAGRDWAGGFLIGCTAVVLLYALAVVAELLRAAPVSTFGWAVLIAGVTGGLGAVIARDVNR